MARYRLNKLVRKKIADQYTESGPGTVRRQLKDEKLLAALLEKFIEETTEIKPSATKEAQEKEVSDVLQVLEDYITVAGLNRGHIEELKEEKRAKKGGFDDGSYLVVVEVEDGSHWDEYFANDPRATRVE